MTPTTPIRGARVLVVEDDQDIRDDLSALLQEEGFEVSSAADGREALSMLHAGTRPDVILLDLMMPTMDAWAFRDEQRQDPTLASIPVLVLTAGRAPEADSLDVQGWIAKPIELEELFAEVRRLSGGG
jgi:CheY-like chemotaxis protein